MDDSALTTALEFEYKIHLYGVNQLKWNTEGTLLASCGNDCAVNVMDMERVRIN
jgi:hypothetical protein